MCNLKKSHSMVFAHSVSQSFLIICRAKVQNVGLPASFATGFTLQTGQCTFKKKNQQSLRAAHTVLTYKLVLHHLKTNGILNRLPELGCKLGCLKNLIAGMQNYLLFVNTLHDRQMIAGDQPDLFYGRFFCLPKFGTSCLRTFTLATGIQVSALITT